MARLIRANSETPNVANNDDFRLFRYATGGYNGVLENYGNECSYTVNGSNFKINSGVIVYQGVDTEILTAGETITVDNISGTQYYVVYLEIDLSDSADQTATIKSSYDVSDYPVISAGDDLTTVPSGVANFELYRFTASSGVINNVVAQFGIIKVGDVLHAENADLATNATNATNDSDGNPINITYTKDSDFNNASQTAFGDYIVEKKKLIWSGTATVTGTASQTITYGETLQSNDFIEVQLNLGFGIMCYKMKASSTHYPSENRIFVSGTDEINYLYSVELSGSTTAMFFDSALQNAIKIPASGNVVLQNKNNITATITAIYKIIQ